MRGKASSSDIRASEEKVASKSRGTRRKRSKRIERRRLGERPRTIDRDHREQSDAGFSTRRYSGEDTDKSRRRRTDVSRGKEKINSVFFLQNK